MVTQVEEIIFSKDVNVVLKGYNQRKCSLQVMVIMHTLMPGHGKEMHIRLTNEEDLLFLQTLSLADNDFENLKSQQGLLVDFGTFPQKLIDLLEMCIGEQNNAVPRFLLSFTPGGSACPTSSHALLEIVETNPFKHLVHLSLKFVSGNDEDIKNYLSVCLKNTKEEKDNIRQQLLSTEKDLSNRLNHTQQLLSERTKELDQIREDLEYRVQDATTKTQRDLQQEKEKCSQIQQSFELKLESKRRDYDLRYNKTVNDFEERLKATQTSNKELVDQKYRLESLVRELRARVSSLEEEKHLASKDVQQLRRQNNHLDSDRHERDKTLNHLRTRVAVLEQEIKDKEQVIQRTNELLETSNEQKNRIEVDTENKLNQLRHMENTVTSVSAEVIKGNEIIQKLQNELRTLKSRVKMMNIVTTKQEKLIEEKDAVLAQNEKEITGEKISIKMLQEEIKQLQKNFEGASQKLNESQETVKNNENVISWLNKQLNEQTINKLSSTHMSTLSPSNIQNGRVIYRPGMITTTNTTTTATDSMLNYKNISFNPRQPFVPGTIDTSKRQQQYQIPYRPILKKPQFRPDGISPIAPDTRNPLRPKQMSTPIIREEIPNKAPVIDPKYLMGKPDQQPQQRNILHPQVENVDPNIPPRTNVKPFVVSSAYFPSEKT